MNKQFQVINDNQFTLEELRDYCRGKARESDKREQNLRRQFSFSGNAKYEKLAESAKRSVQDWHDRAKILTALLGLGRQEALVEQIRRDVELVQKIHKEKLK